MSSPQPYSAIKANKEHNAYSIINNPLDLDIWFFIIWEKEREKEGRGKWESKDECKGAFLNVKHFWVLVPNCLSCCKCKKDFCEEIFWAKFTREKEV